MTLNNKLFYIAAWIAIILFGIMLLIVMFWLVYPYKTIEFKQPFQVMNENKEVKRGEDLVYVIDFVKYGNHTGHVTRDIICQDNRVTLEGNVSNVPPGSGVREARVNVPEKTSLGECKYRSTITYQVNPIRNVIVRLESEPFIVVE